MDYTFHPLADEYPLLQGDEFRALVESIDQKGQEVPIYVWCAQIIDGRNRYRACQELGIACRSVDVSDLEERELPALIERLNLHRRHLSAEWRQQRAAKLRAEGRSYRAIAEELSVSHQTVANDLRAGVKNLTPADGDQGEVATEPGAGPEAGKYHPPEDGRGEAAVGDQDAGATLPPKPEAPRTVVGRDGKAYPATKARAKPPKRGTVAHLLKECHDNLGRAIRRICAVGEANDWPEEVREVFAHTQMALKAYDALTKSPCRKALKAPAFR